MTTQTIDAIWDQLFPAEQTRIVKLLVEKVIVSPPNHITLFDLAVDQPALWDEQRVRIAGST